MSPILSEAWVIVPAWKEGAVIRQVVEEVRPHVRQIVVVDDGSPDDSGAQALAGGAIVLRHCVNLGQGASLQTGIDYALLHGAEYIYTFDADGQHSPDSLALMARTMEERQVDVVLGSRWRGHAEAIPPLRRLMLKAAVIFTRAHSGLNLTDTHNGLRLFTRSAAQKLRITQARMAHASEILDQIGLAKLSYAEAPVTIRYTEYSLAKGQKISGMFRILADIFYERWTR
ncbi:MAG: glycosyltransferase family 2 protein [Bryobacterales bacterium]|nr:glycosyltransferase family 2 protein [Bryobacterales bacterium]